MSNKYKNKTKDHLINEINEVGVLLDNLKLSIEKNANNEIENNLLNLLDKLVLKNEDLKFDIKDLKTDNEELLESTERFKQITENIQDGLTIIENDEITFVNSRMTEITGYTEEEIKQYKNNKEDVNQLNDFFSHLSTLVNYFGDESVWIKKKNGRRCFIRNRYTIKNVNGSKVIKYIATTDITEQWRSGIVKEFVSTISGSIKIIENDRSFFKIIYKEIHKIFDDKEICLGILRNSDSIGFINVDKNKIQIEDFLLKESMCNLLLEDSDAKYYSYNELLALQKEKNIRFIGETPKSWMGATLYSNSIKHGVLVLKDYESEEAFNNEDLKLLKFIAGQITLAIQKNKSEERINQLSLTVEQSPACIVITNTKGEIEYVNDTFSEITGYSKEEVIGGNPNILNSGQTTQKTFKTLWETVSKGETWKGIFINKKKLGDIYYEEAKISPLKNEEGQITHYVAIKEDISERILKEKELLEAKEKAEESNQLKSSFLANMSHEVRTPMNGIMGFSQFLKNPDLSYDDRQRYIKIINESCNQLLGIVEDILEVSKLETGQIELLSFEFNVIDIFDKCIRNYKEKCEQKGIRLIQSIDIPEEKSFLYNDKEKIERILSNLVNNALKFTQEGKIEIGANYKNDKIEFFVRDTGIGIDSEIREKIFESFRQAETDMSRTYGGTGLGLAISKGYLDLINGDIWVESEVGLGSTFYFTIPVRNTGTIVRSEDIDEIPEPIINFNKASVLVAEDEEINFQYIKRVFNGLGIENIIRAYNGSEAVNICAKRKDIDLVMMDLKMPIMSGFEATRKIKSRNSNIPVIAQTALAIPGDEKKALDAGCDDYISKPIDYDKLLKIIENYIKFK